MHTVHVEDVAGAFWACAEWMDRVGGRAKADEIAGEEIPFKNERSKASEVEEMVSPDQKIIAPLFNLVCVCYLYRAIVFDAARCFRRTTES